MSNITTEQLAEIAGNWPVDVREAMAQFVAQAMTAAGITDKAQRITVQAEIARLFGEIKA